MTREELNQIKVGKTIIRINSTGEEIRITGTYETRGGKFTYTFADGRNWQPSTLLKRCSIVTFGVEEKQELSNLAKRMLSVIENQKIVDISTEQFEDDCNIYRDYIINYVEELAAAGLITVNGNIARIAIEGEEENNMTETQTTEGINVLSLFDGISCGMVALERANANYPNIIRLGDITKIDDNTLRTLPKIDLILAGSPCQGFSRNGNMLNFEHHQSKLFFDFIRVLNWIRANNNGDVKFLLENVEMKKEWKDTITEFVKVEPMDINSNILSAQNRPRTYWSNIDNVIAPVDKGVRLKDILEDDSNIKFKNHQGILVDDSFSDRELNLINVIDDEVRISQATKLGYIVAADGDGVNLSFPTSKTRRGRVIRQKTNTLDKQCNVCVYYDKKLRKLSITELETVGQLM